MAAADPGVDDDIHVSIVNRLVSDSHAASRRLRVYVYDEPPLDHTDLIECYRGRHGGVSPWQDERFDMAQNMAEVWIHQGMLAHPWRVTDPAEADLFYVPIYPVLSYQLLHEDNEKCHERTHEERMRDSIMYLEKSSPYFKRFGGADHIVTCAWWLCYAALGPDARMRFSRSVVGIQEKVAGWTRWGCGEREVVIPYVANSELTKPGVFGGRTAEERDIPFFFVGTARWRPERRSLQVQIFSLILRREMRLPWITNGAHRRDDDGIHTPSSLLCNLPVVCINNTHFSPGDPTIEENGGQSS